MDVSQTKPMFAKSCMVPWTRFPEGPMELSTDPTMQHVLLRREFQVSRSAGYGDVIYDPAPSLSQCGRGQLQRGVAASTCPKPFASLVLCSGALCSRVPQGQGKLAAILVHAHPRT